MSQAPYQAWRFVHPDFDALNSTQGIDVDLSGGVAMIGGADSVRQSLQLLLTTRPGERVMRPDYGCRLDELAFAPNDDATAGLAKFLIRQAIRLWEPRIEIVALDAVRDDAAPSRLDILLDYRARLDVVVHRLHMPLDLLGQEIN